jgi:hypothetical protein
MKKNNHGSAAEERKRDPGFPLLPEHRFFMRVGTQAMKVNVIGKAKSEKEKNIFMNARD